MKKIVQYLLIALGILVVGHETIHPDYRPLGEMDKHIRLLRLEFEPDHKRFFLDARLDDSIAYSLLHRDTLLKLQIEESIGNRAGDPAMQPRLVETRNVMVEEIAKLDLNILALADLTLDSAKIALQQGALKRLKSLLSLRNMHVAFIQDQNVSETLNASDYVLNEYFKADPGKKYLYRALLAKYDELRGQKSPYFPEVAQDTIARRLTPRQNVLIIFSDGKVYDHDQPIDPEHFALQRAIVEHSDTTARIPIFYVNLGSLDDGDGPGDPDKWTGADKEAETLLSLLCEKTGGNYFESYDENSVLDGILSQFVMDFANYKLTLVNPDLKIYRGLEHKLRLNAYYGDRLIGTDEISYNLGSVYNPVIVNGLTLSQVILQGCLMGLFIIGTLYLIFQLVVPAVRYAIFKRKYVVRYAKGLAYNGMIVDQSCYYCKAPFKEGDKIVVKCPHVLHKSCWDENEYKCPEYGRQCKTGSHYYNAHRLFDPRNASFYLAWIIAGAIAGLVAWVCFTANTQHTGNYLMQDLIHLIFDVDPNSEAAQTLMEEYGQHLYLLPFYGLNIGFFLTLSLSILTGHGRWLWGRLGLVLLKAIVGGVFSYLSFLLGCVVSIALNFKDNSFLIDWIPWLLSGLVIALAVSYKTDIQLKRAMIGACVSIVFGLGSMYLWSFAFNSQIDMREFLLLSYMIYCVGFAISVAATSPKSSHYFLRVEGPIKGMDIALYKWMNASVLRKRVTIGKSVNCDLQMTWDLQSPIAPEQAMIQMSNGKLYLVALDDGVFFEKKPLRQNVRKRLYHGTKFLIGRTTFTYIEKDL